MHIKNKKRKLVIITLGKANSGKSSTWYEFFERRIRTGWKSLIIDGSELEIFVKNSSFEETRKKIKIDVFIRNASFEEYGDEIESYFTDDELPDIVFCSVQYTEKGLKTINWFKKRNYHLYIQWLNPGFKQKTEYEDFLKFEETFKEFGEFHKRTGKEKIKRINELKQFLIGWKFNEKQSGSAKEN